MCSGGCQTDNVGSSIDSEGSRTLVSEPTVNVVRVDSERLRSIGCETDNVGSIDSEGSRTLVSEPTDNFGRVDSESLRTLMSEPTDNVGREFENHLCETDN